MIKVLVKLKVVAIGKFFVCSKVAGISKAVGASWPSALFGIWH